MYNAKQMAGESSVDASHWYHLCFSATLQPGFPTGLWLCQDQDTLLGKEQLTRLFSVTGNLTLISDAEAEALQR